MKVVNFWKTLFCAALAVTAFSACSDDDEEGGYSGMPEITVNGGESVTVAGKLEGGKLEQTVEVVSKGDWTLTFKNSGDSQWVTPSAMSGKTGTTQLTFTLGQASGERSAILVLTASSTVEGFPLTDEATITVVQSDSDVPTGNALYSENCGTKVEKVDGYWPYVDKFEGWTRGGSLDQKAVTYTGNSASVANSGKVFDPAEDETTVVTGPPYVSMNKSTSVFNINDINIASNTNFTFTFTAAQQINYSNGVVLGDMTDETIRFSVSTDGSSYAPVALKVKKVASGYWYLCTAEFKLPAGVSTDKIWVRFDGYAGLENHGLRIDDFKLYEGGNGSELVVPSVDYTKGTVAEAIAAGAGKNYEVAATVVAMHTQGILIGDASGVMLAFLGEAPAVAVNDAVTVKGTTELRNGVIQFGKEGLSVAKTGTGSYNTPAPEVMDGTAVTAYIATALENKAVYKYVKYNGEFTVSGNYYNVVIAGTTTKGSVAYGKSEWASFNGKPVTVEGWLLGGTANYLQTMATSVTVDSSTPIVKISAPQQFAATSPVAQTLNYTVTNTTASAVTFAIEGTNVDKFSLGAKTDNTIVVSAKGDNTDKTAYTANLVAKVAGATVATVALKQAAPTSGSGYAKIEKVADLKEGTGYLAGLVNGKYQTWTGVLTNKQCETVPYSYTEATGAFVADDAAGAEISLVAVSGVSNAYYIKYGEKYLTVGAAGKNQLVLADSAGDNYWTFTDDTDGVKATAKAFASIMMTSTGAMSKYIRSYATMNTSGVAGVVFFLAK
ncbi:BACON domain-containing protein [Alistipes shahii]|uniref:BACON domain-containing protein n=1 Tax=Alistipes shahii TaxID=328814 RepID=UPI0002E75337|nr:BACON domain-containing protein [Alistipes shahii]UWN68396.1 BACON domain-containing protein [Alistipes shahii WAL 8301]